MNSSARQIGAVFGIAILVIIVGSPEHERARDGRRQPAPRLGVLLDRVRRHGGRRAVPRQGPRQHARARTSVDESAPATVHLPVARDVAPVGGERARGGAAAVAPARGRARPARGRCRARRPRCRRGAVPRGRPGRRPLRREGRAPRRARRLLGRAPDGCGRGDRRARAAHRRRPVRDDPCAARQPAAARLARGVRVVGRSRPGSALGARGSARRAAAVRRQLGVPRGRRRTAAPGGRGRRPRSRCAGGRGGRRARRRDEPLAARRHARAGRARRSRARRAGPRPRAARRRRPRRRPGLVGDVRPSGRPPRARRTGRPARARRATARPHRGRPRPRRLAASDLRAGPVVGRRDLAVEDHGQRRPVPAHRPARPRGAALGPLRRHRPRRRRCPCLRAHRRPARADRLRDRRRPRRRRERRLDHRSAVGVGPHPAGGRGRRLLRDGPRPPVQRLHAPDRVGREGQARREGAAPLLRRPHDRGAAASPRVPDDRPAVTPGRTAYDGVRCSTR